jgi:putative FmdB family regulatory protein
MPTYSYACTACDHRFDVQQGFSDEPLTECPECSARLRKLFGSVGVVFKGSGFYRTDARADRRGRSSPDRKDAAKSGADAPSTAGSGDGATGGTSSTPSGASGGSGSNAAAEAAPAPAGTRAAAD